MKIIVALTLDNSARSKGDLIVKLFDDLNAFVKNKNYGNGIVEYMIILKVINPPVGYEHLFAFFKPKFIEYESRTNRLTGEPLIIEKQFSYSIKITGEKFEEFNGTTDEESKKIIAAEIVNSLSNLDALPKKVKDFDKERFKADVTEFLEAQN